ncbi:uncharacterized protein LOC134251862 [Saccostrea cucullata]|uniref:uncharacterized protein LOC134251862 n=1 Tax=Saccostrea cuccullata TaxID=36930 RepID=UPI002ED6869B
MVIRVYNLHDNQSLSLHLPLLIGDIDSTTSDGSIIVINTSVQPCQPIKWPVVEGAFKVLVELKVGENVIRLIHESQVLVLTLNRYIPEIPLFVRPVYIICSDDDGNFQGPEDEDCSVLSAVDRVTLAAMLVQTFTAEKLNEHGFGYKTFQLEMDQEYEPFCHIFRSQLTLEKAQSMTGNELWTHFAKELMMSNFTQKDCCKWFCFMSFTRYSLPENSEPPRSHGDILKHTKGHAALGGGGLALFGTGNLHTWARSISEIHQRFTDVRKIDRKKYMDDSAYREYHWANYATGLGAALHELGHTFDLAHTPSGVMARGFDDINRVFIVQRYKSKQRSTQERSISEDRSSVCSIESGKCTESKAAYTTNSTSYQNPVKKYNKMETKCYIAPPPLVVNVESNFKPLVPTSLTFSSRNYDGTERHQMISDQIGCEIITDLLLGVDGRVLAKTQCRREKSSSCSSVSSASSPPSPLSTTPLTLPNSPEEPPTQQLSFTDGGAHWYRSSAVLLYFHRWFNKSNPTNQGKQPEISGNMVKSNNGLRLVELRSFPQGEVFHFWEFIQDTPPTVFQLRTTQIRNLPLGASFVTVFVEDTYGNIAKGKVSVEDFSK